MRIFGVDWLSPPVIREGWYPGVFIKRDCCPLCDLNAAMLTLVCVKVALLALLLMVLHFRGSIWEG
jgi:hypothetical protein